MCSCCAALLARFKSGEVLKAPRDNLGLKPVLTSGQTKQQGDGPPTGQESKNDWKPAYQFEGPLVMTFINELALLSACCREVESF